MRRWSLGPGTTLALAAAALLLVGTGALAARAAEAMLEANGWVRHTLEVLVESEALASSIARVESGSRGFAITGDAAFLDGFDADTEAVPGHVARLRELTHDNPVQQARLAEVEPLLDRKVAFMRESVALRRAQGEEAAAARIATGEGRRIMADARDALGAFEVEERRLLEERLEERQAQVARLARTGIGFAAASILLLGVGVGATNRASRAQQAAERQARLDAVRLAVTLDSCGDALIATDRLGRVTLVNPVAEALTGWREADARGLPLDQVFRIVNEFTRETVESPVAKVIREGAAVGLANHTSLLARDGTERPIDDSGAPIRDESGEIHGVILVFRDVSARRRSEQTRERLLRAETEREAAVAANRAKDEFLAMLSHELRNPLAGMLGWVEVLRGSGLSAAQVARAIDGIERSARQQKRLVSDLLDVSRIAAGRLSVERAPLDWNALAAASVEAVRTECESRGLAISYAGTSGTVLVLGDAQRLTQVVENLLSNAAKFTPSGGRIDVALTCTNGTARLTVADTGIGVAPEQRERIFERFWQAASPRARRQEGVGLGLAIVKHIVELHDGRIEVESAGAGRGTCFAIELPLETAQAAAPVPGRRRPATASDLAGVRVLLVDDERDGRDAVAVLLEQRGASVAVAGSMGDALKQVGVAPFDVVVTDLGMPREDGFDLLRAVRAADAERGRRTALVALTGFASGEDRVATLAAGFDEHVGKPADVELLAARIRALVVRGEAPAAAS